MPNQNATYENKSVEHSECIEPTAMLSFIAEALAAAKVEQLERDGVKALRLTALHCLFIDSLHTVKLQTNYDFAKVSHLEVDSANTQQVDDMYLVPVLLHVTQSALKLLFVYFCRRAADLTDCTHWSLWNSFDASVNVHQAGIARHSTSGSVHAEAPEERLQEGNDDNLNDHDGQQPTAIGSKDESSLNKFKAAKKTRSRRERARKSSSKPQGQSSQSQGWIDDVLSDGNLHLEDQHVVCSILGHTSVSETTSPSLDREADSNEKANNDSSSPMSQADCATPEMQALTEFQRSKSAPVQALPGAHRAAYLETLSDETCSSAAEPKTADFCPIVRGLIGSAVCDSAAEWPRTWSPWMSPVDAWLLDSAEPAASSERRPSEKKRPESSLSEALVRPLVEETADRFGDGHLRFMIHELLGQGGFGSVYRCSLVTPFAPNVQQQAALPIGTDFAVKIIDAQRIALLVGASTEAALPRLLREAEIHRLLGQHPYIVTLHFVFYSSHSSKVYIIYELLKGGDLFEAVVRNRKPFNELEARHLFRQLAEGLSFGHKQGIAHRDVKLENCLLKGKGSLSVKLCDYGQAKLMGTWPATARTLTSSTAYTAPDVKLAVSEAQPYDAFKADAFALGVLLYGLLCNALPKAAEGCAYQERKAWKALSAGARDLMQKLLAADALVRISVEDALRHAWLAESPGNVYQEAVVKVRLPSQSERDLKVKMVLGVHQVVVAVQRERGTCMWASGSKRFNLHLRYTDEKCTEVMTCVNEALGITNGRDEHSGFLRLHRLLSDAWSHKEVVRQYAVHALACTPDEAGVINQVVASYSKLVSMLMQAMDVSLEVVSFGSAPFGLHPVRHKLLMFTAEQLGQERALLCGHLRKPESLQEPRVACRVNRVIGARKLLLGSSMASDVDPSELDTAPSGIVAGAVGLLPALNLTEAPLLEAEELAQLENAEDRALSLTSGEAPQLSEWYHLITKLIDKIHQHVILHIVEAIPRVSSPSEVSPVSCKSQQS